MRKKMTRNQIKAMFRPGEQWRGVRTDGRLPSSDEKRETITARTVRKVLTEQVCFDIEGADPEKGGYWMPFPKASEVVEARDGYLLFALIGGAVVVELTRIDSTPNSITIDRSDEQARAFVICPECGRRLEGADIGEATDLLSAHTMIAHKPEPQQDDSTELTCHTCHRSETVSTVDESADEWFLVWPSPERWLCLECYAERRLYVPRMPETEPRAIEPSETRPQGI